MMVLANVFCGLQTLKNFVTPLSKKRHFGTRLDSWHVKGSRILAKSPWECFYQVFSSIWGNLIREIFPLGLVEAKGRLLTRERQWQVSCSILREFATPNSNTFIWKTENFFVNFLFHFWNLHQILKILKKKMMVLFNVFSKLQTVKNFVTPICKKRRFGTRWESRHVKVPRQLAKSPWECFYNGFSSIWWS